MGHGLQLALLGALTLATAGCHTPAPLPGVGLVDLERFEGDWFVIAHIPAPGEETAHNGVESYRLVDDRHVATTYSYRVGGFDGPIEVLTPRAFVRDPVTNSYWGMEFFWPLTFEYRITHLDPAYRTTIIARSARDYVWVMARTPDVPDDVYADLVAEVGAQGYDTAALRRVPQRWPDPEHPAR
ncbi:MAG: lipocalin family protein [Planctomycetota bacterium]|nr:lipocalin family protein [Planctomycetota bacterium]